MNGQQQADSVLFMITASFKFTDLLIYPLYKCGVREMSQEPAVALEGWYWMGKGLCTKIS